MKFNNQVAIWRITLIDGVVEFSGPCQKNASRAECLVNDCKLALHHENRRAIPIDMAMMKTLPGLEPSCMEMQFAKSTLSLIHI